MYEHCKIPNCAEEAYSFGYDYYCDMAILYDLSKDKFDHGLYEKE